jgi:hypothetical protein
VSRVARVWTAADGKLMRIEIFHKRKDALRAAGLSE